MTNNATMIVTRRWALQSTCKSDRNDQKGVKITSKIPYGVGRDLKKLVEISLISTVL